MKDRTEDLIKSIEKSLLDKNMSYDDKIYAKKRIIDLIKLVDNNAQAYVFLGKINVLLDLGDEAISAFNKAILLDSLMAVPHYELFEIYMKQSKYVDALEQIKIYEKKSGINCELYISLLNNYLHDEKVIISNKANTLDNNVVSRPILSNYELMIKSLNKGDYNQALKHVNVCIKLIDKGKYDVDLTLIRQILTSVNRKEHQKKIIELKEGYLNANNYGISYYILTTLLKLEPNNINIIILLIENSILLFDYQTAEECIQLAENILGNSNERINYLKKKVICLKAPMYLNNDQHIDLRRVVESSNNMHIIEEASINGNTEFAIEYGYNLFLQTSDSNYLYMVAKIMYNNGYYEDALKTFKDYILIGTIYLKQAYCYLFLINKLLQNDECASYYASLAYTLSAFIGIDISLSDYERKLFSYVDNFSDHSIVELEKDILSNKLGTNVKRKELK